MMAAYGTPQVAITSGPSRMRATAASAGTSSTSRATTATSTSTSTRHRTRSRRATFRRASRSASWATPATRRATRTSTSSSTPAAADRLTRTRSLPPSASTAGRPDVTSPLIITVAAVGAELTRRATTEPAHHSRRGRSRRRTVCRSWCIDLSPARPRRRRRPDDGRRRVRGREGARSRNERT